VSQEIGRQSAIASQSATVVVYTGGKAQEFAVRKNDAGVTAAPSGCDASRETMFNPASGKRG
jgi:hypothetical protein